MHQNKIQNEENVARAIFLSDMMEEGGTISYAAFSLRHNESYFSVARLAISSWLDDIMKIPQSGTRQLGGYCRMNVGTIRATGLQHGCDKLSFDVEDKSSPTNASHAGIVVSYASNQLKGDKNLILKPVPPDMPTSRLLMKIQSRLTKIAQFDFVRFH